MSIDNGRQAIYQGVQLMSELVHLCQLRRTSENVETLAAPVQQWHNKRKDWWQSVDTAVAEGLRVPLHSLAKRCELGPREIDILLVTIAPLVDAEFLEATSSIRRDYFFRGIDVELVMVLLFANPQERFENLVLLEPDAPLLRHQIITLRAVGTDITPHETEVRLSDIIANLLLERSLLTGALAECCDLSQPKHMWDNVILPRESKEFVWSVVAGKRAVRDHLDKWGYRGVLRGSRGCTLLFAGPPGTGKTAFAHALASRLGRPMLTLRVSQVLENRGSMRRLMSEAMSAAQVTDAIMLLDDCEILLSDRQSRFLALLEAMDDQHGILILCTNQPDNIDPAMIRRITYRLDFDLPSPLLREQLWELFLPPELPISPDVDIPALARAYEFSGAAIQKSVLIALSRRTLSSENSTSMATQSALDMSTLRDAAETQLGGQFGNFAIRSKATIGMESLVLPDTQRAELEEIIEACRNQEYVLSRWGFGKKLTTGRGICVLFDGPPGTGKTLAADVIAAELHRMMFRVHVPHIVSKWVGETERNIAEIFARARATRAILLFDEADSLFGGRVTAAQTATDRYSNMEVNHLLQEIERYDGITLLTTNLYGNLDEALQRRIQFRVSFPEPGPVERAKIWATLMPHEAPITRDIDFDQLGKRFDLPGGHIKNALLRAAYRACSQKKMIGQRELMDAAAAECRAQGKLIQEFSQPTNIQSPSNRIDSES